MKASAFLAMGSVVSGGLGMFAVALLATHRLGTDELGFFFSFLAFGTFIQMADFGLSYATLQTAGRIAGTGRQRELPRLGASVRRWNLYVCLLSTSVTGAVGWATFSDAAPGAQVGAIRWAGPYLVYMLAAFLWQLSAPSIALREGGGKVERMWTLRIVQEWIGAGAAFLALWFGLGLWCLAVSAMTRAVVQASWLAFLDPLPSGSGLPPFTARRWFAEVWPFQWRIGVSGLAGFLIFRAFAPIILLERGPEEAGQFGLAIALMNMMLAVTSAWPMSQMARYSAKFAVGKFRELAREFPALLSASTALAVVGAVTASLVLWQARLAGIPFALSLPDPVTLSIVLGTAAVYHVTACGAFFLRAEGREPLVVPNVVLGLVTVSAVWLSAHFGAPRQIALANLACAFAWIPVVFLVLRARQHRLLRADAARPDGYGPSGDFHPDGTPCHREATDAR